MFCPLLISIQIIKSIKPLMGPFLFLFILIILMRPIKSMKAIKSMNQEEGRF